MSAGVRVNVVVEGQTEETFVRDLLAPDLSSCGVYLVARRVETGRRGPRIHRGGLSTFAKAEKDVRQWLKQDGSARVTTMFDLYRLPSDFPGYGDSITPPDPFRRVRHLERRLADAIADPRFIPHLQLHEFEALLFSDVAAIDEVMRLTIDESQLDALRDIRQAFASPEEIDEGADTAPSKRLLKLYPTYDKPLYGSLIAERIGLRRLRAECAHFAEWIATLEGLNASAG